ncbi:hypothetical protein [Pontibacter sp. SGAir0037]|uniref:hypothetical protein n=1 Tax=Pontibacter sp. SGAir0037 TaxID=2571030 RepID=UPI0010CD26A4|nr:hypothetical protein [Pontibacter sp. SGAir0037]QCR23083.1 hypothetical protein C1N53_12495 [Pontibacter sp. SGAir0037]
MSIQEWLHSNRDYATGRQLYEQHGSSTALKKVFALGESVYNRERLLAELKALLPAAPLPKPAAVPKPLQKEKPAKVKPISTTEKHVLIHRVKEQMYKLYREREEQHAIMGMEHLAAEDRYKHALRVLEISDRLTELWQQLQYIEQHGALPAPEPKYTIPDSGAEMLKLLANLKSQRSRLRNKPDRQEDYQLVCQRIEEIERRLKDGNQ